MTTLGSLYPTAPESVLKQGLIGKDVREVDAPAAVLDRAVLKKNCEVMLATVDELQLHFRAHVKTHKTTQVTRMQLGDDRDSEARIIVSTLPEAEQQSALLSEYQKRGREVSLLYGVPPSSTAFARLKQVRQTLGMESVSFLVDHPAQLQNFVDPSLKPGESIPVFIKIDVGQHRAGLLPDSKTLETLLQAISQSKSTSGAPSMELVGFYSHNSNSYAANSVEECMHYLKRELEQISWAGRRAMEMGLVQGRITLSVGASPTALCVQNLAAEGATSQEVKALLGSIKEQFDVELHAGVYPVLDLQQLASRSRPAQSTTGPTMTEDSLGLRISAEVLSVYAERDRPEALVGAGSLALGREPCKAYAGWGVVAPRPWQERSTQHIWSEHQQTGWTVARISQEHGILQWQGAAEEMQPLKIGEKLLVWPNHACIASAGFDWYVVVDSSLGQGQESRIVDVWLRCRGW